MQVECAQAFYEIMRENLLEDEYVQKLLGVILEVIGMYSAREITDNWINVLVEIMNSLPEEQL